MQYSSDQMQNWNCDTCVYFPLNSLCSLLVFIQLQRHQLSHLDNWFQKTKDIQNNGQSPTMSTLKSRKVMLSLGSGNSVGSLQQRSEKMPQARSILFFLIKLQQGPPLLCLPQKKMPQASSPIPVALVGDSGGTMRHRPPPHPGPPLVAGGGPITEPKSAPPVPPHL